MTLAEQVFAQAQVLAGNLEERQYHLLKLLCRGITSSLRQRLRPGLTPDDCRADFLAAASLLALSALSGVQEGEKLEQVNMGDLTFRKRGGDPASNCLRNQAELIIAPYLRDRFHFSGV